MSASMWLRYRSSARRPAAVRRYSVFGRRPSKDLVHAMYCASSSLRAWTLRFPSVVLRSFLRSLNVRVSLTASALTMPSRIRSWMSRSSSGADAGDRASVPCREGRGESPASRVCRRARPPWAVACLATVPPRDDEAEADQHETEAGGHERVSPSLWPDERGRAERHEHEAHQGDDLDGHRAARDDRDAEEQEPRSRQECSPAQAVGRRSEQGTTHEGRCEADGRLAAGRRVE